MGYVFMEELYRAVAQFYPNSSGGMFGGASGNTPPGLPGPSGGVIITGMQQDRELFPGEGHIPQQGEAGLRAHLDAREQEAAAEDDARLYQAVEGINNACDRVEERIVLKTRTLLARRGIAIEDSQDVNRAVNVAMTEAWGIDIDDRLSHFRNLLRYLGTRNCRLWPEILKELRGLGNPHVPGAGPGL